MASLMSKPIVKIVSLALLVFMTLCFVHFLIMPIKTAVVGSLFLFLIWLSIFPFATLSKYFLKRLGLDAIFGYPVGLFILGILYAAVINLQMLYVDLTLGIYIFALVMALYLSRRELVVDKSKLKNVFALPKNLDITVVALFCVVVMQIIDSWSRGRILFPQIYSDSSLLHLSAPKHYLINHGMVNMWWLRGQFIPQFIHFIYSYGITWMNAFGIRGDFYAAIFNTFLLVNLSFIIGQFFKSVRIALCFLAIALYASCVSWSIATPYLDIASGYFFIIFFLALYLAAVNKKLATLKVATLMASLAFCSKYFTIYHIVPYSIIYLYVVYICKPHTVRKIATESLAHLSLFVLPIVAFNFHNLRYSKQLLFPFIGGFDSTNLYFWSKEDALEMLKSVGRYDNYSFESFIKFMYWLSFEPRKLLIDNGGLTYGPIVSVLLIACFIFIASSYLKKSSGRHTYLLFFICFVLQCNMWFLKSPNSRYFYPAYFALIFLMLLKAAKYIGETKHWLSYAIVFCIIWAVPLANPYFAKYKSDAYVAPSELKDYYFKSEHIDSQIQSDNFKMQSLHWLKDNTTEGDVVYQIFLEEMYLFAPRPFIGDWFGSANYGHVFKKSADDVGRFFSENRVKYIFINYDSPVIKLWYKDRISLLGDYHSCLTEVFNLDELRIYKLNTQDKKCYPETKEFKGTQTLLRASSNIVIPFMPDDTP